MRIADNWIDYELLDMASGMKLERWGKYILERPDPQIVWSEKSKPEFSSADSILYLVASAPKGKSVYIDNVVLVELPSQSPSPYPTFNPSGAPTPTKMITGFPTPTPAYFPPPHSDPTPTRVPTNYPTPQP